MVSVAVSSETWDSSSSPISEIDVLWITAGLGCDGDTIAMTAATQPSIEDILLGAIPWIPKVRLHNPFLASEVGEDFIKYFHHAADGKLRPFILVVEGSIPNELNKKRLARSRPSVLEPMKKAAYKSPRLRVIQTFN